MLKASQLYFNVAMLAALLTGTAHAAGTTKDIVLDRVLAPVASSSPTTIGQAATQDAMVVSVLLESPDGTLSPKSTNTLFRTGDRFRIKVIASRDAKLSIYNTTPLGELKPEPVWQGQVAVGQETISSRLVLTNESGAGSEMLHFVLEPASVSQSVFAWLGNWLDGLKPGSNKAAGSKDVRLDVQNTAVATYTLSQGGQGLVNTIRIAHR